jgi:UDP-N-acetylglucosamine 2-epimerase (hydrolysing)
VVIHGDRVEAMAASIVCAMRYIRSAHIEGGEVSGTIDESIRHCNTKLCATHFVSSEDAKARVLSLGEAPERVFNIGSPELDTHAQPSGVSIEEVKARYAIPFDDYGIVIFHPVTSEVDSMGAQAASVFGCLVQSGKHFVVIAPNNDPGTDDIFAVIEALPKDRFRLIPSMRFNYFSELMKNAAVMVGNSSAGVREAPFLGLPSLDVGSRQNNRAQADSIFGCSAFDQEKIQLFLTNQWHHRYKVDASFGNGMASDQFVQVLKVDKYWEISIQK